MELREDLTHLPHLADRCLFHHHHHHHGCEVQLVEVTIVIIICDRQVLQLLENLPREGRIGQQPSGMVWKHLVKI